MCTVTFIPQSGGFSLGMNRDEKLTRPTARPPRPIRNGDRTILYPSEPSGGTWIGFNDTGLTLALINWYSIAARVTGTSKSRGTIIPNALPFTLPSQIEASMPPPRLAQINPFRLIGVFPTSKELVEWRWNLEELIRVNHRWLPNTWISSGFDEPGAQQIRRLRFNTSCREACLNDVGDLRQLHRSHDPEAGPYSTCMHRSDAATVSYTEITITSTSSSVTYTPGAPCCTQALPPMTLSPS